MLVPAVLTIIILGLAWFFFFRKTKPNTQSSIPIVRIEKSKNDVSREPAENLVSKKAQKRLLAQQQAEKGSKSGKSHGFFYKSFKKNESAIIDYDFSLDLSFLVIASKDRNHVCYCLKDDSCLRFETSKLL